MKILEFMSFNPEWFLTVPGILITAGVILLLIALILLLTSGKKEEEKVEEVSEPVNPVADTQPQVEETIAVPQMPEVSLEQPVAAPTMEQPVAPVFEQPTAPAVDVAPVLESASIPVIESVPEVKEEPKIEIFEPSFDVAPVAPTVNVEAPVSNNISSVEEVKVEEPEVKPTVSIYGGASPVKDIFNQPEQPKVIYGGADPLENTGSIPKVEVNTVIPSFNEVTPIMEPTTPEIPVTQTAVMDNSVTETISAAPTVSFEPVESVMPTAPEVAPVSALFETPVAPVVESQPTVPATPVAQKEEIETLDF